MIDDFRLPAAGRIVDGRLEPAGDPEIMLNKAGAESVVDVEGPPSRRTSMKKLLLVFSIALVPLALMFGAAAGESYRGDTKARWQEGSRTIALEVTGSVEFTDDDRDVKSLSPYGRFSVAESRWWVNSLRYQVNADGSGRLTRSYYVDGDAKPLDGEGQAWLTQVMPEVIREMGIGVGPRVQRILHQRGPTGVLAEIRLIHRDEAKRTYLEELIRNGNPEPGVLRSAMLEARKIGSDDEKSDLLLDVASAYLRGDLRDSLFGAADTISSDDDHERVLSELVGRDPNDAETLTLALHSAARISADGEKAKILAEVAERYKGQEGIRWAYFKAANSISSDDEHHNVLSAVLKSDGGDRETLVASLRSASRISSDDDKAAVLAEASRYYTEVDAVREAYFDAANTISSDEEHQKALTELLHQPGLQPATLRDIAKSAQRISSDDEKAKVLSELVALDIQDSTVRPAFFDAVNSIGSDEDHARVLSSLGGKGGLTSGTLEEILESASRVSSDEEKANVLVEMWRMELQDEGAQSAYFKAADSISSDDDHGRVLTTLLKRHDLSAKVVIAAIESATHISSDDVKAELLRQVVDAYSGDALVCAHLRLALESLQSNDQYRNLMSELAKQQASQKQSPVMRNK